MTAEQLSTQVYEKLVSLNYTRKPNSFGEATVTNFDSLPNEVQAVIHSFPSIYIDPREDLMDVDSLDGKQQFYLVENEIGTFLIDNQGYNYPRYITELIEFEKLDDTFEDEDSDDTFERMEGLIRIADSQIFESVVKSLVVELANEDFDKSDIQKFLLHKLNKVMKKVLEK